MAFRYLSFDTAIPNSTKKICTSAAKVAINEIVLVHDGKIIIAKHDRKSITGTGNPLHKICIGSKIEIESEIKKLGLVDNIEVQYPIIAKEKINTCNYLRNAVCY